ncbi:MAG: hypothetical protein ABIO05_07985 [Ferruginibacter sp.]
MNFIKVIWGLMLYFLCALLICCAPEKKDRPATALDTGRAFIRASLDGDFKQAEILLLNDSQNLQLFQSYKMYYNRLPASTKKSYKDAAYTINKYDDENDSTTIINYANTFMNKPMDIKVLRKNAEWQVDFKYAYIDNLQP